MRCFAVAFLVTMVGFSVSASAKESQEGLEFFEKKIRPVLVAECYGCHSSDAKSIKGGLVLDSRQASRLGGDSGEAVIPGNADESLIMSALRYEDYEMPPKGKLPDAVIADFETWINMGAPDPREQDAPVRREIDIEAGRNFWAFRKPEPPSVPAVQDTTWTHNTIDAFILARLEAEALAPVGDATPEAWLRRVSFDLTGLPPTEAELSTFLADESDLAREAVVDRLLDSPRFGERWAQHWLDVARYAESTGRTRNYPFPFAWRYRDYVINAINKDKPLDQFIVEQLAGDLLPKSDDEEANDERRVATGFLALGAPDLNERNAEVFRMDMVADQIDTISKSMLGLTVGCARCHDHKFDPIPTEDYYALAGIFRSTQLLNGYTPKGGGGNKARPDLLIRLGSEAGDDAAESMSEEEQLVAGLDEKQAKRLIKAKAARDEIQAKLAAVRRNKELPKGKRKSELAALTKQLRKKQTQFNQLQNRLQRDRKLKFEGTLCLGVRDGKQVADCKVHIRGDARNLGHAVPRGFLQVVNSAGNAEPRGSIPDSTSGRLQLAHWIASAENPLTARVFVNRVWQQLFGHGIVRTVDNFGVMGERPSHSELLDHLAVRFVENGWSLKQLLREIALSRTYGLDVSHSHKNASVDADNRLLWRMNARRLDYEALRDALLTVSGSLNADPPAGSPVEKLNVNEISKQKFSFDYENFRNRGIYLPMMRNLLPAEMKYFDVPDATESRGTRDITTVPTQSLYLLNSPFVVELAHKTAAKMISETDSPSELVKRLHRRLFGRETDDRETERLLAYAQERIGELEHAKGKEDEDRVARLKKKRRKNAKPDTPAISPQEQAWSEVVQAMFASAEFRYR